MESPPKVLYKYFPVKRTDFFVHPKVRFTPTAEFNDPFEFQPAAGALPLLIDLPVSLMPETDLFQAQQGICAYECGRDGNLELREIVRNDGITHNRCDCYFIGRAGILCLSENPDNILMWGHYAEDHKGIVIGFNTKHVFFNPLNPNGAPIRNLVPVEYVEKRKSNRDVDFAMYKHLYLKSKLWKEEKEWRMVQNFEISDGSLDLKDVPIEAVSEIIVGVRASDETKQLAKDFCKKNCVQYFEAARHLTDYSLELTRKEV